VVKLVEPKPWNVRHHVAKYGIFMWIAP